MTTLAAPKLVAELNGHDLGVLPPGAVIPGVSEHAGTAAVTSIYHTAAETVLDIGGADGEHEYSPHQSSEVRLARPATGQHPTVAADLDATHIGAVIEFRDVLTGEAVRAELRQIQHRGGGEVVINTVGAHADLAEHSAQYDTSIRLS